MKKIIYHPIFYILLQVLGICVDGVLGVGFEMMAMLIISLGKKRTLQGLLNKGLFIISIEIMIDVLCGDAEMIFETIFWVLEEMKRMVFNWALIFPTLIIFVSIYFQNQLNAATHFICSRNLNASFFTNHSIQSSSSFFTKTN